MKKPSGPKTEDFSRVILSGKKPTEKGWQHFSTSLRKLSPEQINGRNVGVVTGPASDCLVLDVDDEKKFQRFCKKKGCTVPETFTVITGRGLPHYYFQYPKGKGDFGNKANKRNGFDVRGKGGQVVCAGSIHPDTGKPYLIKNDVPMATAPKWLLDLYAENTRPKTGPKTTRNLVTDDIESLPIKESTKNLIKQGADRGNRSEPIMTVINALIWANLSDENIYSIFNRYPIGDKYREKGKNRRRWLQPQIDKARTYVTDRVVDRALPEQAKTDEQVLEDFRKISEPDADQIKSEKAVIVRILNKKFAAILIDGKFLIIWEYKHPVTGRRDISYLRKQDFLSKFENRVAITGYGKNGPKFSSWAQIWLRSPNRREFDGLIFDTQKENGRYYNLYVPPVLKSGPGNCELYLEHLKKIICKKDDDLTHWVLDWMAWMVQNKGQERPGTAIVLRGSQGTGKGTFVEPFGQIFGTHFLHITQQAHFSGRFTEHFKNVILAFIDEALWAGDKRAEGHIKGLITEPTVLIEPKFVNPYPVKNHVNFIFASNSNWIVPTGLEERRFLALHVSSARQRDYAYFREIKKQMKTGGVADLAGFLMDRKVTSNLREAPRTEEFLAQAIESMEPEEMFWYNVLLEGELHDPEAAGSQVDDWPSIISKKGIYTLYKQYCERINVRNRLLTDAQLGKRLRGLVEISNGPRTIIKIGGARLWTYKMPPLEAARKQFESKLKYRINWDKEDEQPF